MPVCRMPPQEVRDWLGSWRVLFGARPPASSTGKPTGSSNQDPSSEFRTLASGSQIN
jgi:hypothetical protein